MSEKQISISFQDLAIAINIIDVASKRGAFEGKDLSTVGQVRDRIQAFLVANAERSQESSEISEENLSPDPEDGNSQPDKE